MSLLQGIEDFRCKGGRHVRSDSGLAEGLPPE